MEKAVTKAQLVATLETLRELIETLHSSKFDPYVDRERRDALLERLASIRGIAIMTPAACLARET